jgi:hypothetical protein
MVQNVTARSRERDESLCNRRYRRNARSANFQTRTCSAGCRRYTHWLATRWDFRKRARLDVPVVQWIEQRFPKPLMRVRFSPGIPCRQRVLRLRLLSIPRLLCRRRVHLTTEEHRGTQRVPLRTSVSSSVVESEVFDGRAASYYTSRLFLRRTGPQGVTLTLSNTAVQRAELLCEVTHRPIWALEAIVMVSLPIWVQAAPSVDR